MARRSCSEVSVTWVECDGGPWKSGHRKATARPAIQHASVSAARGVQCALDVRLADLVAPQEVIIRHCCTTLLVKGAGCEPPHAVPQLWRYAHTHERLETRAHSIVDNTRVSAEKGHPARALRCHCLDVAFGPLQHTVRQCRRNRETQDVMRVKC